MYNRQGIISHSCTPSLIRASDADQEIIKVNSMSMYSRHSSVIVVGGDGQIGAINTFQRVEYDMRHS